VSDIKKGPSPRSIPNVDEVIKTIERIKGLKLIITPIIEKIENVEMCVKEIIR